MTSTPRTALVLLCVLKAWVIILLTAVFVVFARPAYADEGDTWAVVTCCSKHVNAPPDAKYNERNWGAGFEHELTDRWRLAAGTFQTSHDVDGTYVLAGYCLGMWRPTELTRLCLGAAGGAVAGYSTHHVWAVLPMASVDWNRFVGANMTYVPPSQYGAAVIGLQLKTTGKWEPLK